MIDKIIALVTAAICLGLIAFIAPGFAREIEAAMPFGKPDAAIDHGSFAVRPPDLGCSRDPWPYGCDWRASSNRTQIAKRGHNRHHWHAVTAVGSSSDAGDEF
jgi:hypothetical protein